MSSLVVDPLFNRQETTAIGRSQGNLASRDRPWSSIRPCRWCCTRMSPRRTLQPPVRPPDGQSAGLRRRGDSFRPAQSAGPQVAIFARVLRAEPGGRRPPAIVVDGPRCPTTRRGRRGSVGASRHRTSGETETGRATKGRRAGATRSVSLRQTPGAGRKGPSRPGIPTQMDGAHGGNGHKGNAAGHVWICCDRTDFGGRDVKLR